jgi:N-acetylneuraminic acid mutarotase
MRKFILHASMLLAAQAALAAHAAPLNLNPAPVARSNWAVARRGDEVFAFYGLGVGKSNADIARDVHALDLKSGQWRKVGDMPVAQGRLASAAVTVGGAIYVIGGYTVSDKGEEVSTPEILRFSADGRFATETTMPVPVDDTVAMPWRDRWIVLVSGWHDKGNVSDVQIYDTHSKSWTRGTPWPGQPVFGHAGGLAGDAMVVCDGVTAMKKTDGKNAFAITDACWQGTLDSKQVGRISWRQLPAHPGAPLYRAGALGSVAGGKAQVIFAGGSGRPYNYNGIGYDGMPSEPSAAVYSYQTQQGKWQVHAPMPEAGMDYRGLIALDGGYALFGGMRAGQQVSGGVIRFGLAPAGK